MGYLSEIKQYFLVLSGCFVRFLVDVTKAHGNHSSRHVLLFLVVQTELPRPEQFAAPPQQTSNQRWYIAEL
jgi:hypothetical protein